MYYGIVQVENTRIKEGKCKKIVTSITTEQHTKTKKIETEHQIFGSKFIFKITRRFTKF